MHTEGLISKVNNAYKQKIEEQEDKTKENQKQMTKSIILDEFSFNFFYILNFFNYNIFRESF